VLFPFASEIIEQKDKVIQWCADTYNSISKWIISEVEKLNSMNNEPCMGGET